MHHEYSIKNFPKNNRKGIYRFIADKKPCRSIYHMSDDKINIYFDKIEFDHDDYDRELLSQYKVMFKEAINKENYKAIPQEFFKNLNLFADK